jgi:hypothetical protein
MGTPAQPAEQQGTILSAGVPRWWEGRRAYGYLKLALAVLVFVVYPIYLYNQPRDDSPPPLGSTYDIPYIIRRVAELAYVPNDESVSVTQIVDVAAVRKDPFFSRVLIDDVLVMYPKEKVAILFDPVTDKILNMNTAFDPAAISTANQ